MQITSPPGFTLDDFVSGVHEELNCLMVSKVPVNPMGISGQTTLAEEMCSDVGAHVLQNPTEALTKTMLEIGSENLVLPLSPS